MCFVKVPVPQLSWDNIYLASAISRQLALKHCSVPAERLPHPHALVCNSQRAELLLSAHVSHVELEGTAVVFS